MISGPRKSQNVRLDDIRYSDRNLSYNGENATRNINFNQRKRTFTKKIEEEVEVIIPGDHGTNGRPRIKEIPKPLPTYDQIDLQDPNDEILFQGEVAKYKACINPNFMPRWI